MTARFILSLDCEGKWGVADGLTPTVHRQLSDANLRTGYERLVALLDDYQIPATFAFVGLFAQNADALRALLPELRQRRSPDYLDPALDDFAHGSRQGWSGDWAVDCVAGGKTRHEIALHGVTHIPWDRMSPDEARAEMGLIARLAGPVREARTFVYPRNLVAHAGLLKDFGMAGFRQAPRPRSRPRALLSEFNLFTPPDRDAPDSDPLPIPAGHFVNWQSGLRRAVPMALSEARGTHMLDTATSRHEIVHFWLHPENIASAPRTMILLERILRQVARQRDAGRCEVLTQIDYFESRRFAR